jgi:hypothetical protein
MMNKTTISHKLPMAHGFTVYPASVATAILVTADSYTFHCDENTPQVASPHNHD